MRWRARPHARSGRRSMPSGGGRGDRESPRTRLALCRPGRPRRVVSSLSTVPPGGHPPNGSMLPPPRHPRGARTWRLSGSHRWSGIRSRRHLPRERSHKFRAFVRTVKETLRGKARGAVCWARMALAKGAYEPLLNNELARLLTDAGVPAEVEQRGEGRKRMDVVATVDGTGVVLEAETGFGKKRQAMREADARLGQGLTALAFAVCYPDGAAVGGESPDRPPVRGRRWGGPSVPSWFASRGPKSVCAQGTPSRLPAHRTTAIAATLSRTGATVRGSRG